ncbi:hypothetical protein WN48_05197 [Eufriesea mexicana]|uniref:Uncharacterized protein n=1 Tax=Eufriesea mexicana TaxID=516756 RepID=A0A310S9C5_9HYME|nr:hypothetical protein WN48_05197 [Eufriesea mexicana]
MQRDLYRNVPPSARGGKFCEAAVTLLKVALFDNLRLGSVVRERRAPGLRVTMSQRRGTAVYYWDPPLKLVLLSEHVCTPQGSFPPLTMPLRRLRSYLQLNDLRLRLDTGVHKEMLTESPLDFSLSLVVDSDGTDY